MIFIVLACLKLYDNDELCKHSPLSIVALRSSLSVFIDSWQQKGEEDEGEKKDATPIQIELREP